MPYCPGCGTQNSDTAKYCTNCGAAMPGAAADQKPPPSSVITQPVQLIALGSKVIFNAADGKTYTGTIKEIRGDQYKIRYDAFNFETWLGRNQFTVSAVNTVPPVYPAGPQNINPRPLFVKTGSPFSPFVTHPGFWGSLIIVIGFFTNWLNLGYNESISGFDILKSASGIISAPDEDGIGLFILATDAVIILSAVICLLYMFIAGVGRGVFVFFKLLPLLSLIALVVYIMVKSRSNNYDDGGEASWKILGIGIYLTMAGSLILAISKSRK